MKAGSALQDEARKNEVKDEIVIRLQFRNAYDESVREHCKKRYADGYIGYIPVRVLDGLNGDELRKLDDLLCELRMFWQEPDSNGCVLNATKSREFLRRYSDQERDVVKFYGPTRLYFHISVSPNGGRLTAQMSLREWGESNGNRLFVELDNLYPSFKDKAGQLSCLSLGYHGEVVSQFLELSRYRGYFGFDGFKWLERV